ncbi:MAG: membrane integrity-associated transporter subunit PqiC [Candidatus Omnitrophica bacterium]|nr:membrane integrity-associated transporter subunit PqiC [Candidatus Omnitrophota bacterium]
MRNFKALFILVLFIGGCISVPTSPTPRFYTLQSLSVKNQVKLQGAENLNNIIIGVGPVTLPEYFNRPQIVTKNSNNAVEFSQFDRWAEPLEDAIARIIAKNFTVLLPETGIDILPWNSAIPRKYQVTIEVIELNCNLKDEAMMLLQWSIIEAGGKKLLLTERKAYREKIESGTYPGLVRALSVICESISKDIAGKLIELG